jgi:hypothetical protein
VQTNNALTYSVRIHKDCAAAVTDPAAKKLASIFVRLLELRQADLVAALKKSSSSPTFRRLLVGTLSSCANRTLNPQIEKVLPDRHIQVAVMGVGALHVLGAPFRFDDLLTTSFFKVSLKGLDAALTTFSAMWAASAWPAPLLEMMCGRRSERSVQSLLDVLKVATLSTEGGGGYVGVVSKYVPPTLSEGEVSNWIDLVKCLADKGFDVAPMVSSVVRSVRAKGAAAVIKFVAVLQSKSEATFASHHRVLQDLLTHSLTALDHFERWVLKSLSFVSWLVFDPPPSASVLFLF